MHKIFNRQTILRATTGVSALLLTFAYAKPVPAQPAPAQPVPPLARPIVPDAVLNMTPPAHAPAERFGVATHMRLLNRGWTPDLLPMISAMGVANFRDEVSWVSVEKTKGTFTPHLVTNEIFERSTKLGLDPLYILAFNNPIHEDSLDPAAFTRYASWMIEQQKGKIKYLEIWNEPDNFNFLKTYGGTWNGKEKDGSDSPWIKKFAEFATYVSREIKKKHPEVKLVGYSASAPSTHRLFKYPDLWKNLDVLAVHPYPYKLPPEVVPYGGKTTNERDGITSADDDHSFTSHIRLFREGLKKAGRPDMPIWITETGYNTAQVRKTGLWQGFSESAQATYLTRLGILSAGNGVARTYFYDFYNDGNDRHEPEHNFGLVRRDYTPKPSYLALQRLCSLMPGDTRPVSLPTKIERLSPWPRQDGQIWDGQPIQYLDTPQSYAFERPDGSTVVFLWQPGRIYGDVQEELANVTINFPNAKIEQMGRVVSGQSLAPKINVIGNTLNLVDVPYGADPVYLVLREK